MESKNAWSSHTFHCALQMSAADGPERPCSAGEVICTVLLSTCTETDSPCFVILNVGNVRVIVGIMQMVEEWEKVRFSQYLRAVLLSFQLCLWLLTRSTDFYLHRVSCYPLKQGSNVFYSHHHVRLFWVLWGLFLNLLLPLSPYTLRNQSGR